MKNRFASFVIAMITIAASVLFTWTIVRAAIYDPGDTGIIVYNAPAVTATTPTAQSSSASKPAESPAPNSAPVEKPADWPERLAIPTLNINTSVQDVGINAKGNIGTPDNFTDVAWYSYGVVPGEAGDAIIDGHVDNGLGLDGIFKHLSDLEDGADIYVTTYDGTQLHFVVTDTEPYDYQNVPVDAVFGSGDYPSGTPELKLITCDGTWVQGGDTYDERLIVTAVLVQS